MDENEMDLIVKCPACGGDETYGNIHWRNGRQYCRRCIADIWREDENLRRRLND